MSRLAVMGNRFGLIVVSLLLAQNPCRAENSPGVAALIKRYPELKCNLRFSQYRERDARVSALLHGADASGLFGGRVFGVRSVADVERLQGKLQPGDQIVIEGGRWKDCEITIRGAGTFQLPIIVRAAKDTVLTGNSSLSLYGSHFLVYALKFVGHGDVTKELTALRLGEVDHPCNDSLVYRVHIENYNSASERFDDLKVHYVSCVGTNNTIAKCTFKDKENMGTMVSLELPHSGTQRIDVFDNTFSGFSTAHKRKASDGEYKFIQLGSSEVCSHSAYSVMEENKFEHDMGQGETVSIKACDVIVRRNKFIGNQGGFNLRSTDRCLVEQNLFDGEGQDDMGGVRISGANHWVIDNVLIHLIHPRNYYDFPISIHTASDPVIRDGQQQYGRVDNVVVAGNKFEFDNEPAIAMGIYPDPAKHCTLLPTNVHILDNLFMRTSKAPNLPVNQQGDQEIQYIGGREQYRGIDVRNNNTETRDSSRGQFGE